MARERNSESTFVYLEPLSEESDIRLNRNEMYINDDKVNQYVLQNNRLNNVTLSNQFPINQETKIDTNNLSNTQCAINIKIIFLYVEDMKIQLQLFRFQLSL